jgi:GNAT superfamily N-acetyltransferase
MDETAIRPATEDDLHSVAALRWQWLVEENGAVFSIPEDMFIRQFASWAHEHAQTHRCLVAERDGAVIGMAIFALFDRVPTPRDLERVSAELQCVYVAPTARSSGIGARLIDSAVTAAGDFGAERITVHSSERAVTSYARAGFSSSERFMDQSLPGVCRPVGR